MREADQMFTSRDALTLKLCRDKVCAEVGVCRGVHAAVMLSAGPVRLYLVDPWRRQKWQSRGAPCDRKYNAAYEEHYKHVVETLGRDPRVIVVRSTSVEAAATFGDGLFDVVHIDADHSEKACAADTEAWWLKVKPGGWLYGHDYDPASPGVVAAVGKFLDKLKRERLDARTEKDSSWGIRK